MTLRLGTAAYLAMALSAMALCPIARGQEIVHGADSLFVAPTAKIAWAVCKGASDNAATVVIRVVNRTGAYQQVRLDGVEPFSKERKILLSMRPLPAQADLLLPRSDFAAFPSVEIRLYGAGARPDGEAPSLTVYYLSVPDTTPEFPSARAADAYLTKILAPES